MTKTPQQLGREYEKTLEKDHKLKAVKGSGSLWYKKGDLVGPGVLVQAKHTIKPSFSLTDEVFTKHCKECRTNQTPVMFIKTKGQEYLLLDASWADEVLELIEDLMT